jgi:hypothetical protein
MRSILPDALVSKCTLCAFAGVILLQVCTACVLQYSGASTAYDQYRSRLCSCSAYVCTLDCDLYAELLLRQLQRSYQKTVTLNDAASLLAAV